MWAREACESDVDQAGIKKKARALLEALKSQAIIGIHVEKRCEPQLLRSEAPLLFQKE